LGKVLKILTSPLSLIDKKLGSAVSKIALTAISLMNPVAGLVIAGVGMASSALAKRPKSPQVSQESIDRLNASIDPRTPRKMVLGRTAMATDIRDQEYTNSQEYLHRFVVVAAHKVQAIEEIWFDDKKAWTVGGGAHGEYAGYLTVTPILEGSAGNAINISARLGSTRRFTGLAYVHLRYKLTGNSKKTDSPFAQGIPTRMTIRGKGAFVYDPRLDSTVPGGSGSHRAADQSTWAWSDSASRNPALELLWYLLGWKINGKLSVGRGIPSARIDLESFAIAANLCDETVSLAAGGTEPRYRSDGVFSEGDSPTTVIDNFKAAMNADLDDVGGKLRLTVFHNDLADPVAAFDDDDMIEAFRWKQTPSLTEAFNIVRGSYTDPSDTSLYQMVDYPQIELASPDGIDRIETFDLALVESPSQAQRLAKQRLQRQQYGGEFQTVWGARGWRVQKNSVVTQTVSALGWVNKLFRVAEMEHRVDGTCPVVLREENADIYAWDEDESAAVVPADPTVYDFTLSPIFQQFEEIGDTPLGLTISASPPVFNVARTAGGSPKSGELPKSLQVQVLDGESDVTASCTFSNLNTECSVSNEGGGAFTLTALDPGDDDAFTDIEATYGARVIPIKITVAKPKDGSAASRASASVSSMNATSTYMAIAQVDIVAAAGATIAGSASVNYNAASFVGAGTRTVRQRAKVSIENLTDAGSPTDGTAVIGTAAAYVGGDGPSDVGSVAAGHSVTNSTGAPKTFRLKFLIQYYDGATTADTTGGTYNGSIEAQVS
jgi:hypothetical protein